MSTTPKTSQRTEGEAELLRIFLGEADTYRGRPLFEAIIYLARDRGLDGATVLRGVEGFGERGRIHAARLLRLSEELPLVIEIIDTPERLAPFVEEVEGMIERAACGGLMTFEKVRRVVWTRP